MNFTPNLTSQIRFENDQFIPPTLNTKNSNRVTKLRAIIIDDEPQSLEAVSQQIKFSCPQVEVIATCDRALKGIESITLLQPDLIFLDIEMPGMTGLEMLEKLPSINFGIIFITAFNKYAIDAIKLSALDYLMKPLDTELLEKAVKKAEEKFTREKTFERFELMIEMMERSKSETTEHQKQRIALPTIDDIFYESLEKIVQVNADKNYCEFLIADGRKLIISKNIGYYEEALADYGFMRVHRSHIVNLNFVQKYSKADNALCLNNGKKVDVSRGNREKVLARLARM